jgi:hypothetical protein
VAEQFFSSTLRRVILPKRNYVVLFPFLLFLLGAAVTLPQLIEAHSSQHSQPATENDFIIVNHLTLALFDDIPDAYIEDASELTGLFRHASVGANIYDGLRCLMNDFDTRPTFCDAGLDPDEIFFDEKYDYTNWQFEFHAPPPAQNPGWWEKVNLFTNRVNNLSPNEQYDTVAFKFGYVDAITGSNIAVEFFNPNSNFANVSTLEALEAAHPDKVVVWWSLGLARSIGTAESTSFNQQFRAYTQANNKIVMDIAAITSHTPDGTPCFDNQGAGHEAMCANYTEEVNGGHLNARGRLRVAKAYWVLMALLAGWEPDQLPPTPTPPGPTNTPTTMPTAGPTNTPTATPTAGPTNTPTTMPTATSTPGATNTPTATPTPGPTNTPAATPTAGPTNTPTTMPTATSTPGATNTPTAVPTPNWINFLYLPFIINN